MKVHWGTEGSSLTVNGYEDLQTKRPNEEEADPISDTLKRWGLRQR